jgi:hypothetical protein
MVENIIKTMENKAKEKARQLIEKYNLVVLDTALGGSNIRVKQCALICCDEVLGDMGADRGYEFWSQVKDELHKL